LRSCSFIVALVAAALLTACAQVPADPDERAEFEALNDPFEPMNRTVFDMNTYLDRNLMKPAAVVYRDNVPEDARTSVHNFLVNLNALYVAGNDLLQAKPQQAADQLGRFVINSTWGFLGLFDVFTVNGGPKAHENDIGVTLGVWGLPEGPFLMLPFVGPASTRDTGGRIADFWASPTSALFAAHGVQSIGDGAFGAGLMDSRSRLIEPLEEVERNAIDMYASVRSLYRQQRDKLIRGNDALPPSPASLPGVGVPPSQQPEAGLP
jgi:phospholipid-binding lipoprotein MlaA